MAVPVALLGPEGVLFASPNPPPRLLPLGRLEDLPLPDTVEQPARVPLRIAGGLRQVWLPVWVKGGLLAALAVGDYYDPDDKVSAKEVQEAAAAGALDSRECRARLEKTPRVHPQVLERQLEALRGYLDFIAGLAAQNLELRLALDAQTQAQAERAAVDARFQAIFDGIPDAVLLETPAGKILDGNEMAFAMHGYTRAEMLQLHVADLVAPGYPVIYPLPNERLENPVEGMNRRKDGSFFPIELSARAVELDGETALLVVVRDISARKRLEEEAQRTSRRLESTLEATEAGLWDWDIASGQQYSSPRWYTMLGYPETGFQNDFETFLTLVHPEDLPRVKLLLSQHFNSRSSFYEAEFRMRRRDGKWVWILSRGRVTERDAQGRPLRMVGTHIDISQRKSADSALRASEERFYKSFQTSPDSISIIRLADNIILDVNEGFVKKFAYNREEIVGKTSDECNLWAYPEEYLRLTRDLLQQEETQGVEATLRAKDGASFIGQISARMIELNGDACMLIITRDITDRKRAEELLRDAHVHLEWAYEATLLGWNRALEMRDVATKRHSDRCIELTIDLAQAAGLSGEELTFVRYGVILHDIGKLAIPDLILNKPGPLSAQEWSIMRRHSFYAQEMLQGIDYLQPAMAMITGHHERWDGNGYPLGLAREEIPLTARIFSIVDVWDSMIHDRPWRKAIPEDEARAYIRDNAGYHFDPGLVEKFFAVLDQDGGSE